MSEMMQTLFEAGSHIGYSKSRRHPSIKPYVLVTKNTRDVIDLEATTKQIENAITFLKETLDAKKTILFVGTKPEARAISKSVADNLNQPYVDERWVGGTLTNFDEIKKRVDRLADLLYKNEHNELVYKTKKEKLLLEREMEKLQKNFGGLLGLKKRPDAVVIVDVEKESIAVAEAHTTGIPVVGIANTDCSINGLAYPIVANDVTVSSIDVIMRTIGRALA